MRTIAQRLAWLGVVCCVWTCGAQEAPPVVDPPRQPGQGPEQPREGFPEFGLPPDPSDEAKVKAAAGEKWREAGNLLRDPSFEMHEAQPPAWFSFAEKNPVSWGPFAIAEEMPRTGERSALLELDSEKFGGKTRIHGVIQEFKSAHAPEEVSGWYRVEGWERGAPKQYLQVVVILWGARDPTGQVRGASNLQIAYTLAGVEEAPLSISNRKFVLAGPPEPAEGEWVRFEVHPRKDFNAMWGTDPTGFEYVRVLFEVRFDEKDEGTPPARAKVYYDDLYAGE